METLSNSSTYQETSRSNQTESILYENLYPSQPLLKKMFKSPLLLWRLGLGPVLGQIFMVITTTGRKSFMPRRTVVEYREWFGMKYAFAAWPKSDWYQNIQADPYVTIQTKDGSESVMARQVTDEEELSRIYLYVQDDPLINGIAQMLGFDLTRETFLQQKDKFHLLAFEPTDEPTPLPLQQDLLWVWPLVLVVLLLGLLLGRPSSD